MKAILSQYSKYIRNFHERENKDPRFPTLSESDLEYHIQQDIKIAKAYLRKHGFVLRNPLEMRLWWALSGRTPTDFALTDTDKHWLNTVVGEWTEEEMETKNFPTPPSGRLLWLIECLKDTASVKGRELNQDAYDYMIENCPPFAKLSNEIYEKWELSKVR